MEERKRSRKGETSDHSAGLVSVKESGENRGLVGNSYKEFSVKLMPCP